MFSFAVYLIKKMEAFNGHFSDDYCLPPSAYGSDENGVCPQKITFHKILFPH
jgi:hypothetical protein